MAKGRMIDAVISNSRKVNSVSDQAALLFTWAQAHTDDFGRLEGEAEDLLFLVVPRRNWTVEQVEEMVKTLFEIGLVKMYHVNDKRYLEIVGFDEHQTLRKDRNRKGKYPNPEQYDSQWFTKDGQRLKIDSEVKLSQVKLSQAKLKRSKVASGKPVVDEPKPTPADNAKKFFEGIVSLENKQPVEWLSTFLEAIAKKNSNISKAAVWGQIRMFKNYWTEPTHNGKMQRWQIEKTFEIERRLVTWFSRAGFKGFSSSVPVQGAGKGKQIIGLNEDTGHEE